MWIGFLAVLAGFLLMPVFAGFEPFRDYAWPGFVLSAVGLVLLLMSAAKARRQGAIYRGQILAPLLAVVGFLVVAFMALGVFHFGRIPAAEGVPGVGQKAPDFSLPDQDNNTVTLADLISPPKKNGALLIFYRGHW